MHALERLGIHDIYLQITVFSFVTVLAPGPCRPAVCASAVATTRDETSSSTPGRDSARVSYIRIVCPDSRVCSVSSVACSCSVRVFGRLGLRDHIVTSIPHTNQDSAPPLTSAASIAERLPAIFLRRQPACGGARAHPARIAQPAVAHARYASRAPSKYCSESGLGAHYALVAPFSRPRLRRLVRMSLRGSSKSGEISSSGMPVVSGTNKA